MHACIKHIQDWSLTSGFGPYFEKILEHALHIAVLESGSSTTDFEYVIGIQEAFQAQSRNSPVLDTFA